MLMDSGGNAGSQSATMVIRGLALDEIREGYRKGNLEEFRVSLLVGFVMTLVNFIRVYFIEKTGFIITLTISISLYFTIILANLVGSSLPIIAKKLKLDPAIMAAPMITTIVDALALFAYFSIASWLLGF